jgi:sodium pump decarboxylase gamma subunit
MNASIINEGIYIGILGMIITFAVLTLLGFILFLFKVFIYKSGTPSNQEETELSEQVDHIPEVPRHEISDKKKVAAIIAAIAQFFGSEKKTEESGRKMVENKSHKSLKEKRWRNG